MENPPSPTALPDGMLFFTLQNSGNVNSFSNAHSPPSDPRIPSNFMEKTSHHALNALGIAPPSSFRTLAAPISAPASRKPSSSIPIGSAAASSPG